VPLSRNQKDLNRRGAEALRRIQRGFIHECTRMDTNEEQIFELHFLFVFIRAHSWIIPLQFAATLNPASRQFKGVVSGMICRG